MFGITNILKVLITLKFKLTKGIGKSFLRNFKFVLLVRLINFLWLTVVFFDTDSRLCFCKSRPFFFEHCSFVDLHYTEYKCYPYDKKEHWGEWAKGNFTKAFPEEPFSLTDRSLYDCLSGNSYKLDRIDRSDITYSNEYNSDIVKNDQ